jgi:hypothetical protein
MRDIAWVVDFPLVIGAFGALNAVASSLSLPLLTLVDVVLTTENDGTVMSESTLPEQVSEGWGVLRVVS